MSGAIRAKNPATLLLAVAMTASGLLFVVLGSRLSFFLDDWVFILYRRDFSLDAFLGPDNEHLVAGPVAMWKLLLSGFGMGSALPFHLVLTAMFLLGAWFLFVWIRRRLGAWPALLATLPILFLGAAYEDLFWFSSITFLGSMACGLGMLVALDRRDATGDRLACAWLVGSMLFSSLWLAFLVGAAVDVALRRRDRDWRRRAYVIVVPVILYAIWWLGWADSSESSVTLHNIALAPRFAFESMAATLGALTGFATSVEGAPSPPGLDWGRPLTVVLGGLAVWHLYRLERVPRSLWVVLAIAIAFWLFGGIAVKPGRVPWASRYQYPSAALVILVAAGMLSGLRLDRRLLPAALIAVAISLAGNVLLIKQSYDAYLSTSQLIKGNLTAMEIARNTVDPAFFLEEEFADTGFDHIDAGSYFAAVDDFGSPAYTIAELQSAGEPARFAADKVLLNALRIQLEPIPRSAVPSSGCTTVGDSEPFTVPAGGVAIAAGAQPVTDIRMTRFATPGENAPLPVDFQAEVGAGEATRLVIPRDLAPEVPWKLQLEGGPATVCALER
ncbi:MAG TPA: hypothetical protein VFN89_12605 [Solirubrobacterales bacterium]|nr:hypothetical protein [Solirubrobacterales bacterium]